MCTIQNYKHTYPRLLADIGGTNARFALEVAPQQIEHVEVLACNEYHTIIDAVNAYLQKTQQSQILYAAFAIANPVVDDWIQMTNHHWAFSIETTRQALGFKELILLNDFTAQALAITKIEQEDLVQVGGGVPDLSSPKVLLGPGTGLGVSGLIPRPVGGYIALSGEGGHASFAAFDDNEVMIWEYARKKFGHVSAERFLSGDGLALICEALAYRDGIKCPSYNAEQISTLALNGESHLCRLSLDIFCAMLGTVASNLALTLGARGGVFVCGGIIPRFIEYFKTSPFRARFEDKGRFSAYLAAIPVYVVLAKWTGIVGVSVALENYLLENDEKAINGDYKPLPLNVTRG